MLPAVFCSVQIICLRLMFHVFLLVSMTIFLLFLVFSWVWFHPWHIWPTTLRFYSWIHWVQAWSRLIHDSKRGTKSTLEPGARGPVQPWPLEDVWGLNSDWVTKQALSPHLIPLHDPWAITHPQSTVPSASRRRKTSKHNTIQKPPGTWYDAKWKKVSVMTWRLKHAGDKSIIH